MNGKIFVGKKALSLTEYKKSDPITGVILWVDNDNCFQAGDDTGTVIENDCPYGTQGMADALLDQLKGYEYQGIDANGARVTPVAELGDGLTINGIYTQLAYQNIRFSTGEVMDVAAPGKNETLHEYQTEGETSKWFSHQIAQTYSEISKTAEEIRLEVKNEIDGLSASIDIKLDSITSQITGINGQVSSITQTVDSISSEIRGLSGDVSSIEQKVDSISLEVSNSTSSSRIQLTIDGVTVASQTIRFTGDVVFESDLADGNTTISGDCITTGEVSARYIKLGGQMDVYESLNGRVIGGYFGYMEGVSAGGSNTNGLGILGPTERSTVICTNSGVRMGFDGENTIVCTSTQVSITGDTVFINGVAQSSDARLKTDVKYDVDDYLGVFDKLKPATFIYKDHKRRHMGFIAQEIQETLKEENIPESNFAAICTEVPNEERPMGMYSLRYGELQIMTVAKVQQMDKRLAALEARLNE